MRDVLMLCVTVLLGVVGLAIALFFLYACLALALTPFVMYGCEAYGQNTQRETRYNALTLDCYVKMPNGWFTTDQINQISVH